MCKSLKICCRKIYYIVWSVLCKRVYRTMISNVNELKRCINSEWATLSHPASDVSVALAFVLEADIFAHDDVMMWCDTCDFFWVVFVAIQLIIQCTLNYCVDGSIRHFEFPKVMQAHRPTSGEVGTLCSCLLRVYSCTFIPIFNVWQTRNKW